MDEIHVLQIGATDWSSLYNWPEYAAVTWAEHIAAVPGAVTGYEIVFWDREPEPDELEPLDRLTQSYTLYVTERVELGAAARELFERKSGRWLSADRVQSFLDRELLYYYPTPYGEKFHPDELTVSDGFRGSVRWEGQYSAVLTGSFGDTLRQAACWRFSRPLSPGPGQDFWLEYCKTPGVRISLTVTRMVYGSIADIIERREYTERELRHPIHIRAAGAGKENVMLSLNASGEGELRIIALHNRTSRGSHGVFLPGGKRFVTSQREEFFCYLDAMDAKPPLNVYFAGYKTQQGFEGYYMMRSMGAPFLLISEPRLEGGAFYMGSEEYERMLTNAIRDYMRRLGFTPDEVILSGLSMGTYGALYYGCDIGPHALLLGKPLASIGDVAENERIRRPGGFPTSLDVLRYLCGGTDETAVRRLNDRFWKKYEAADWSRTKFAVSYMMEDDYDGTAYESLLEHQRSGGAQLYGRGLHGRHNDNTSGIVTWFRAQYKRILREDFGRGDDNR